MKPDILCDRCEEVTPQPTLLVVEYCTPDSTNRDQDYALCQPCTRQIQTDIMDLIHSRTTSVA